MRRRASLALAVLIVFTTATPAGAKDATAEEFRELAARAAADVESRPALVEIDSVEGTPVDTSALLEGTEAEVSARLRAVANDPGAPAVDAAEARARARAILDDDRFVAGDVPRPVRGLLQRLGQGLEDVLSPVGRAIAWLERHFPGGRIAFRIFLGLLVLGLLAYVVARFAKRRARGVHPPGRAVSARLDPTELERLADRAEREGDFKRALRLRFRAGLMRLEEAHAVTLSPYLTSGELGRRLRSPSFALVARTFDEVVYGGRPAAASDAALARDKMRSALQEAGVR